MKRIVVLRFSAMGDVALCTYVLKNILLANPTLEIVMLTKKPFHTFFEHQERLSVEGVDFNKKYKGPLGLLKLKNDLIKKYEFDAVVDLHDVIRTKILRTYFKLSNKQIVVFDKGRDEKEKSVATKSKQTLKHTTERYFEAFEKLGLKTLHQFNAPHIIVSETDQLIAKAFYETLQHRKSIGFAPLAKHESKTLPLEQSQLLIEQLCGHASVILFGGKEDKEALQRLQNNNQNVHLCLDLNLAQQLHLMCLMNVFISMDSANMHLAALQGVKTLSIWGGTLPHLGFAPLNSSSDDYIINPDNIACQPCSVFGNKTCSNKTKKLACLHGIHLQEINQKVLAHVS